MAFARTRSIAAACLITTTCTILPLSHAFRPALQALAGNTGRLALSVSPLSFGSARYGSVSVSVSAGPQSFRHRCPPCGTRTTRSRSVRFRGIATTTKATATATPGLGSLGSSSNCNHQSKSKNHIHTNRLRRPSGLALSSTGFGTMPFSRELSFFPPAETSAGNNGNEANGNEANAKTQTHTQTQSQTHTQTQPEYTMDSLMGCAERLVRGTAGRSKLCFFVAGGGSTAVSALASTPGASAVLSEGRTTYDRHSFLSACGVPDRDTAGRSFSYGGRTAAGMATRAALEQGLALASMDSDLRAMPGVVGIGCASVLVSNPRGSSSSSNSASANNNNNNNNENAPPSGPFGRGTVVAASADGWILTLAIQMNKPRSRFEEELVLGHLVLEAAERMGTASPPETKAGLATVARNYETPAGDGITENWEWAPCLSPLSMDGPAPEPSASGEKAVGPLRDHPTDVVEAAARRVVEGGEDAVVLLPVYAGAHPDRPSGIRALSLPVLPNGCLVFPGSFHPPHAGHLSLAGAAVRTLEALEPYAHPRRHNEKPVLFELSLTNADKPAIDPGEVVARVSAFLDLASGRDEGACAFPEQWGIVLTRAPLFGEKIRVLRKGVLDRLEGPGRSPRIRFVIGTDTLVRILDPKYYPGRSLEGRDAALKALGEEGAAFVVGGRLEQGKNQDAPRFVSGREELAGLRGSLARMFAVIDESDFRVDLSSSELRARKEAGE